MTTSSSSKPKGRAKGFGETPARPQQPKSEEELRRQRLGKTGLTNEERRRLLSETIEQAFRVGSTDVKLLVPSYVMDYGRFAAMVEAGTGTVSDIVWPAEQALAHILLQRRYLWASSGLCELGAGLGLAGITAAVAGAPRVLLTDRDALILGIAERSAVRNNVADRVSVSSFDWADRSGWPVSWSGLVVAADILYDKEVVKPLASLIQHLGGEALLMEPNTQERRALGSAVHFEEVMRSRGLSVSVEEYLAPVGEATPMLIISVGAGRSRSAQGAADEGTEVFDSSTQTWVRSR